MKKIYTSEDVAKLAGVSQATVSRVFAGNTNVSEKKRAKVLKAAQKLGYKPNAWARSMITGKSRIIGIITRSLDNPFYASALAKFHSSLSAAGYHLIFINSASEHIEENEINQLLEYNVEGVIITDALLTSDAAQKFKQHAIPVVLFNRYIKSSQVSAVYCDNYLAAKQIATYLVETGHRFFAFISGPRGTSTTSDRLKGLQEVLAKKNIKHLIIEHGNYTYESGFKCAQELIAKSKFDCIFCGNDITALGAMDALRLNGIKVPDEVSVVGFDNIPMSGWIPYSLTTWEQPIDLMVESATKILLEEINDKTQSPRTMLLKGRMITRNSVKIKANKKTTKKTAK